MRLKLEKDEVERALILDDPRLEEHLDGLLALIGSGQADRNETVAALRRDADGVWRVVLRRGPPASDAVRNASVTPPVAPGNAARRRTP